MTETETNPPFDPVFFVWSNLLTLIGIYALYKLFLPELWAAQLSAPLSLIIAMVIAGNFVYAFVEYFFHNMHAE